MDRAGELECYVPKWLLRAAGGSDTRLEASASQVWAAVLFADISGFTRMMRLYQDRGDAGVEELALVVGRYLGGLIDRVLAWGGDIEKLYGDAFLAFWPAPETERERALANALGCASEIVAQYDGQLAEDGSALRLRCALAAGDLRAVRVGGRSGQWHFFMAGPSFPACLICSPQPGRARSQAPPKCDPRFPDCQKSPARPKSTPL